MKSVDVICHRATPLFDPGTTFKACPEISPRYLVTFTFPNRRNCFVLLSFISIFVSGISFLEFQRIEVIKFGKICGIGVFKCIIIVYLFITQFDGKETHGEVYGNVFKNSVDKINLQNISWQKLRSIFLPFSVRGLKNRFSTCKRVELLSKPNYKASNSRR